MKKYVKSFQVFESMSDEERDLDLESGLPANIEREPAKEFDEYEEVADEPVPGLEPGDDEFEMEPAAGHRPAVLHDPGYGSADRTVLEIVDDLKRSAHTGDDELASAAIVKWVDLIQSENGHIGKLGLKSRVIDELIRAIESVPNHKEIIASATSNRFNKGGHVHRMRSRDEEMG